MVGEGGGIPTTTGGDGGSGQGGLGPRVELRTQALPPRELRVPKLWEEPLAYQQLLECLQVQPLRLVRLRELRRPPFWDVQVLEEERWSVVQHLEEPYVVAALRTGLEPDHVVRGGPERVDPVVCEERPALYGLLG